MRSWQKEGAGTLCPQGSGILWAVPCGVGPQAAWLVGGTALSPVPQEIIVIAGGEHSPRHPH